MNRDPILFRPLGELEHISTALVETFEAIEKAMTKDSEFVTKCPLGDSCEVATAPALTHLNHPPRY